METKALKAPETRPYLIRNRCQEFTPVEEKFIERIRRSFG